MSAPVYDPWVDRPAPPRHAPALVEVSWYPWPLSYADDTVVEEMSSWSPEWFDVPLYPNGHVVENDRCVCGWIPFGTRKGSKPEYVTYGPFDSAPIEWTVK
ncbi:hypothetical protein Pth03_45070 [Planotetraspora thailandica]|uniref:Uncharacterized protein n=1 Tax=Planotetraspora thailandica TaxID=487172 RepID=A0A8J3XZ37_9ACTN|nr:hypothetical protein Pth03_45070 [Planotetraspora thailandica]